MMAMADDEFYEDDEPIKDVRAAWNAGEKGTTSGPRDLNQRAKSIVERAVARFEERQDVLLPVVAAGTNASTEIRDLAPPSVRMDRADAVPVSASEYLVG
jgi:hypothetical protein